jgi:hypothetical protein
MKILVIVSDWREQTHAPHPVRLLRAGGERPRGRAAEKRDEFAPSHVLPQAEGHTLPPLIGTVLCITANLAADDRLGSCVTSIAMSLGDAQLYER